MSSLREFKNADCMEEMIKFPNDYFDVAIVDPPYFSGPEKENITEEKLVQSEYRGYTRRARLGTFRKKSILKSCLELASIK